jgi:hypothetical protein
VYDIIGDIHGHYDQLAALLRKLGYRKTDGAWRHAGRQAIFVGDLIDRGPQQVETVNAVRAMVDADAARCVQGNHEFNAVAWTVPDPDKPGEYLRPHGKGHNRAQHQAFLDQVGEGSARHAEFVAWFRTLPLWLDLGGLRVVHACWHEASIDWLAPQVDTGNALSKSLYVEGSRRGHKAFHAIETVCKGIEVRLPEGVSFTDKGGVVRKEARIRWWEPELLTFRQAAIGPPVASDDGMDSAFPPELRPAPYLGPPVFFGHYWMTGEPRVLAGNAVCLDYSVANEGPLVAYRWDGESRLSSERFVMAG